MTLAWPFTPTRRLRADMLQEELSQREAQGLPIRLGVSGAGWIGSGFVYQVERMQGMRVEILADPDVALARRAFEACGVPPDQILETDSPDEAIDAVNRGQRVVTPSYRLAAEVPPIDIVADVTPSPDSGAETAMGCIEHGKDVVMVNIEADVTVGRILKHLADRAGVLYTVSSGDEPGCLMELWDFVTSLGFEPIVIGKGKNNPLNPLATPDDVRESARKSDKDPYQVASYVDGTKTMFEMTCSANATGCLPQQRSMIGPQADLDTVSKLFALEADGGLIKKPGTVDFVQGPAMSGGVFITVRIDDARLSADLQYLKVGQGHYFTFFRPYHLWFLEAPLSVARAFIHRQTTLVPLNRPVAEVLTIAKRDLKPGETLDAFGGYTFHGAIDEARIARELNALPVGLAPGAKVVKPVVQGQVLTWDDVALDEDQTVVRLRRQQDLL
jgi:predicted homoserine dehydrogenase-like protein